MLTIKVQWYLYFSSLKNNNTFLIQAGKVQNVTETASFLCANASQLTVPKFKSCLWSHWMKKKRLPQRKNKVMRHRLSLVNKACSVRPKFVSPLVSEYLLSFISQWRPSRGFNQFVGGD